MLLREYLEQTHIKVLRIVIITLFIISQVFAIIMVPLLMQHHAEYFSIIIILGITFVMGIMIPIAIIIAAVYDYLFCLNKWNEDSLFSDAYP
jgi:hypothetical protein